MAAAWIEPADTGWGALQMLIGWLADLGYRAEKVGGGDRWEVWLSLPPGVLR